MYSTRLRRCRSLDGISGVWWALCCARCHSRFVAVIMPCQPLLREAGGWEGGLISWWIIQSLPIKSIDLMVSPRARPNSDAVFLMLGARGCERHNSERALSTRRTPRRLSRTHTFIFHRVRLFLYHSCPWMSLLSGGEWEIVSFSCNLFECRPLTQSRATHHFFFSGVQFWIHQLNLLLSSFDNF